MAAGRHEHHDDVVAGHEVGHVLADRLDDARRLVPEGHRHGPRAVAVDDREVGVAQPGRADPHQDFAAARPVQLDRCDAERLACGIRGFGAHAVQDGCFDFHDASFLSILATAGVLSCSGCCGAVINCVLLVCLAASVQIFVIAIAEVFQCALPGWFNLTYPLHSSLTLHVPFFRYCGSDDLGKTWRVCSRAGPSAYGRCQTACVGQACVPLRPSRL